MFRNIFRIISRRGQTETEINPSGRATKTEGDSLQACNMVRGNVVNLKPQNHNRVIVEKTIDGQNVRPHPENCAPISYLHRHKPSTEKVKDTEILTWLR